MKIVFCVFVLVACGATGDPESAAIKEADIAAASQWAGQLGVIDWLGPLAPLAMSPFFGVAVLSGLSLWGPDFVSDNSLLASARMLGNPAVFWVFFALTLATSIPRFFKVSKLIAQATDFLESYSVIIILLTIRLTATWTAGSEEPLPVVHAGIVSFSADALLSLAMVLNFVVIRTVRFVLEFAIFLTPIPLVDAFFEILNKTVCAALLALYAFSPLLATVVNLLLFTAAALVYRMMHRQMVKVSRLIFGGLAGWLLPIQPPTQTTVVTGFPDRRYGPFAKNVKVRIARHSDCWQIEQRRWFLPAKSMTIAFHSSQMELRRGWLMNDLLLRHKDGTTVAFAFDQRHRQHLPQLATNLGATLSNTACANNVAVSLARA